jgi:hypothetical protein
LFCHVTFLYVLGSSDAWLPDKPALLLPALVVLQARNVLALAERFEAAGADML